MTKLAIRAKLKPMS